MDVSTLRFDCASLATPKRAMSVLGQGRLWPAGGWHSRSTPSSGNTRAFWYLRFVPNPEVVTLLHK